MMDQDIDLVISVCARAACPAYPRAVQRIHLSFHDPHGELLASFIAVRDGICARLMPTLPAALAL